MIRIYAECADTEGKCVVNAVGWLIDIDPRWEILPIILSAGVNMRCESNVSPEQENV